MVTLVNLTGSLDDLIGTDFVDGSAKVWIEANAEVIIDATGNQLRLGDAVATIAAGSFTFTGLWATNSATNPTAFQYKVYVQYTPKRPTAGRGPKQIVTWDSGWFSLTATSDLADVAEEQYAPPSWQTTFIQQAESYLAQQEAVAGITGEDTAVAYLIANSSSTRTAADARYSRKASGGLEVSEDFSTFSNGAAPSTTVRTGQTAQNYGAADVDARTPWISGGKMTYKDTATGDLGSYRQYPLEVNGGQIVYMEAGFTFSTWSVSGGLACIALMEQDFVAYHRANNAVPRSPFHLLISPSGWSLGTFPTAGGAVVTRQSGSWRAGNLTADDTTVHRVAAVLDGVNGVAYLFLPDGSFAVVSHADLKIPAAYGFAEVYRDAVTNRTVTKLTDVRFSTRRPESLPMAKTITKARSRYAHSNPGSTSNMTLNTTPTAVSGTGVTFITPPSGVVLLTLEAFIDVTTAGPVYLGVFDTSNSLVIVRAVATKVTNGHVSITVPYTPTAGPGGKETVTMCAYRDASAVASLLLGNGSGVYASAHVTVTPADV